MTNNNNNDDEKILVFYHNQNPNETKLKYINENSYYRNKKKPFLYVSVTFYKFLYFYVTCFNFCRKICITSL